MGCFKWLCFDIALYKQHFPVHIYVKSFNYEYVWGPFQIVSCWITMSENKRQKKNIYFSPITSILYTMKIIFFSFSCSFLWEKDRYLLYVWFTFHTRCNYLTLTHAPVSAHNHLSHIREGWKKNPKYKLFPKVGGVNPKVYI